MNADTTDDALDMFVWLGAQRLREGEDMPIGGDLLAVYLTLLDPKSIIVPENLTHPVMRRIIDRLRPHIEADTTRRLP